MVLDWLRLKRATVDLKNFGDLFDSEFRIGEKVCVLASGPNGSPFHERIPEGYQVFAVNKAVTIEVARPAVWVCNSNGRKELSWQAPVFHDFQGVRLFSRRIFNALINKAKSDPELWRTIQHGFETAGGYYFKVGSQESVEDPSVPFTGRNVIAGCTVSGMAIHIAALFGARDILICGVDMGGMDYWDGSRIEHWTHGETWEQTGRLNLLISRLTREQRIRIRSISPTRLEVPVVGIGDV